MSEKEKYNDIEQLMYRELPPDRYCYIHNFIVEKDKEMEKLADVIEEQQRHIKEADYEIERLNNIINELEKIISLDFNYVNNDLSDNFVFGIRNEAKFIYRELQSLKGDSSNERTRQFYL